MTRKKKSPRKTVVQKAQQRKAEQAGKKIGKEVLIQAVLEQVEERLKQYHSANSNTLQQVLRIAVQAGQGVNGLAGSHDDLNNQFAVMIRLFFIRMNHIIDLQNRMFELACENADEAPENPEDFRVPNVTYEEINQLFALFDEFKKRPDYQEHFRTWYTGGNLNELPPPPEPPAEPEAKEEEATASAPEEEIPEGAEVFGGDYGSQNGNGAEEAEAQRAEEEATTPDPVSELRGVEDSSTNDSRHEQDGAVVPHV